MVVREDEVERDNGTRGIYGVVEKYDSAIVIAVEAEQLFLIEQFRYPIGECSLEFPQGSLEQNDIPPMEIARDELKEETGIEATHFEYLGEIIIAIGYSNQKTHAFVATGLQQGLSRPEAEEDDLKVRKVSIREFEELLRDNVIRDSQTLAAWALYRMRHPK
jgi:8-oxo-dGTP pyrophosphatase MutT (NUDIX family)